MQHNPSPNECEYTISTLNDIACIKPEHFEEFLEDLRRFHAATHTNLVKSRYIFGIIPLRIRISKMKFIADGQHHVIPMNSVARKLMSEIE